MRVFSKKKILTAEGLLEKYTMEPILYSLRLWGRRTFSFLLNLFVNRAGTLRMIGALNRRFHFLGSIFLVYPADDRYAEEYIWPKYCPRFKWKPYVMGIYKQGSRLGLVLGVSAKEEEFRDPQNKQNLRKIVDHVERVRDLTAASVTLYAGILPGLLCANRIIRAETAIRTTVQVIIAAIRQVSYAHGLGESCPILIIGGGGYLGRRLREHLEGRTVYSIDPTLPPAENHRWPHHLHGIPAITVNVSRPGGLGEWLSYLWPEMVLIDDVYPPPDDEIIQKVRRIGCPFYHIVGVPGWAFPDFPGGYRGAVPCCAAIDTHGILPVLRRLDSGAG